MCISLIPMTKELCRQYYKGFKRDPDIYMDMSLFKQFLYSDSWADAYFERQRLKRRIFFAIMSKGEPIGEIILKNIDEIARKCTLSIHLQNDSVKGQGIGTKAERLALIYAFSELNMASVNADAVIKNERSQHVLEKVGFHFLRQEGSFRYYHCTADSFYKFA
ncbi:GNAT family N-acetyltransferase [Caproicibacter sp.]|uniref:GNAT family N-acetyltransferase n=1 Tax=Caproicibacter sp. TaxID=2814884 RepID=UPI0039892ACE